MALVPCCKILISKKNQKVHLDFATEHILWTEEQWNMVHFSNESKFNLFESDVKRFVRRKNGERLSPQYIKKTVKFGGGSVMVWVRISSAGIGLIVYFNSNINASIYKELLRQNVPPHLCKGTVKTPIFMQDNVPYHKAKTVLSFLEEEGIVVMKWPLQSSDLNLIENVWKIIGEKVQNRNPQNIDDIGSYGWRCNIIQCKGKFTKY